MAEKSRVIKPITPKLVGSLTAMSALAACVLTGIDSWDTFFRGIVAYLAGHFAGSLWDAVFGNREQEITIPVEYEVQEAAEDRLESDPAIEPEAEETAA